MKGCIIMWKVLVLFNEKPYGDEEEELTMVTEKVFDTYDDAREYVRACESNLACGGMVFRYHPQLGRWSYYMDIQ